MTWITLTRGPSGSAQMQLVPAPHLHPLAVGIGALERRIRFAVAASVLALETRPIVTRSSSLPRGSCGSPSVKDPIGFDPQQATGLHLAHAAQERSAGVPAVANDHRAQTPLHQQLDHRLHLAC